MNIENGVKIGSSMVGAAVPEIIYEVSARTVDFRNVLPLRLLFTGLGGTAGHIIVSVLHGFIEQHKEADTHEEQIPSEVWGLLKSPPVYKPPDKDK